MSTQLAYAEEVLAEPEVTPRVALASTHQAYADPCVIYGVPQDEADQRMSTARGIAIAVLISAPVWVLIAFTIYMLS